MKSEFTFELAQQLHDSTDIIDFDWAWQVLGYSRKDSAKRTLVAYFEQNFDFFVQLPSESLDALPHRVFHIEVGNSRGGRPTEKIYLTVECFKQMGMLAKSEEGKQIRKYFLTCEALAKQSVKAIPHLQQQIQQLQQNFEQLQSQVQNLLPVSADFIPPGWDAEVWQQLPPQDKRHFRFLYRRRRFRPSHQGKDEPLLLPAVTTDLRFNELKNGEPFLDNSTSPVIHRGGGTAPFSALCKGSSFLRGENCEQIKQKQQAELQQLIGEVSQSEKERLEAAKQELLKRFWAEGEH